MWYVVSALIVRYLTKRFIGDYSREGGDGGGRLLVRLALVSVYVPLSKRLIIAVQNILNFG